MIAAAVSLAEPSFSSGQMFYRFPKTPLALLRHCARHDSWLTLIDVCPRCEEERFGYGEVLAPRTRRRAAFLFELSPLG